MSPNPTVLSACAALRLRGARLGPLGERHLSITQPVPGEGASPAADLRGRGGRPLDAAHPRGPHTPPPPPQSSKASSDPSWAGAALVGAAGRGLALPLLPRHLSSLRRPRPPVASAPWRCDLSSPPAGDPKRAPRRRRRLELADLPRGEAPGCLGANRRPRPGLARRPRRPR